MLTAKQARALKAIQTLAHTLDHQPTIREVAEALCISESTVHKHIQALIQQGYLRKGARNRGYQLVTEPHQSSLPLLGKIAAGQPIAAIADQQNIDIADLLCAADRYALHITGDSMIEAGILDGDYVIVAPQATANQGDIVVALIQPDDEATLKYYYPHTTGVVELRPANRAMQPLYYPADNIRIQGVVVGQFRDYRP